MGNGTMKITANPYVIVGSSIAAISINFFRYRFTFV